MTISVGVVKSVNAKDATSSSAVETEKEELPFFDPKDKMEEEGPSSSLSKIMSISGQVDASTLPASVSPGSSVVAAAATPSEESNVLDVHRGESSGKFATSFADGLDIFEGEDGDSSSSNDILDYDDSDGDVSLLDSEDDNLESDASKSNANEVNDDTTSSISAYNDDINEVFVSNREETTTKDPSSNLSRDGCSSQTDDSSDSSVEKKDFNENDKMQTSTCDFENSMCAPTKTDALRTRRGLQRKPTGDSDTLGELLHGVASARRDDERLINRNDRRGRRNASNEFTDAGKEEVKVEALEKGPLRTRRGIQRIPTGDSDTLADMIKKGSKCISDSAPVAIETTRRGGRRKTKNDAQVEVTGIAETVKAKEPLKTRRGVQRKATGDSDTLVALVQGLDPRGAPSHETSKVRRGGRKKERTSDDLKDTADPSSESKGPLRTRKGLRRQATGDSDTLADLIARKGSNAA
jgi:hypothetical protein